MVFTSFVSETANPIKDFFGDIFSFFTPRELAAQGVGDVRGVKKKRWF